MGRSVVIQSRPKCGKTQAALSAYPDAYVLTPGRNTVIPIARSLGLTCGKADKDFPRVKTITNFDQLAKYIKAKGDKFPIIIDDMSVLAAMFISANNDGTWAPYQLIGERMHELCYNIIPSVKCPVVMTMWSTPHSTETRDDGKVQVQGGLPDLPGQKLPGKFPGMVDLLVGLQYREEPFEGWPYQVRIHSDPYMTTGGRTDVILPPTALQFRAVADKAIGGVTELFPGYNDLVAEFEAGERDPKLIAKDALAKKAALGAVLTARDEALTRAQLASSELDHF